MIYTNKYGLPAPLVDALKADDYVKVGDISVTGLIKAPYAVQLEKRYGDQIVVDVSEYAWRLLGKSVHYVLSQTNSNNRLVEERLTATIDGWVVSGQGDLFWEREEMDGPVLVIGDYKVTSVFSFLLGDKPDWEAQLNLYRLLYSTHGFLAEQLEIYAILRDHMFRRALREPNYPACPIHVHHVPVWPMESTMDYLRERVALHQAAERAQMGDIPPCTPEERWQRNTTYACKKVNKKGAPNKTAMRGGTFSTPAEAEQFVDAQAHAGVSCIIEERPSEAVRCLHFCAARSVCPYAKQLAETAEPEEAEETAAAV